MKKAIYPGSFDPLTLGHIDIIKRASGIVDELVVGVLNNSAKNSLFSLDERVSMIEEMTKDLPNVSVTSFDGLLVEHMKQIGATIIVRGLRAVTDFEYELQIAQTNHVESPAVETIFLTASLQYSYLSSTIVKEFASYGGDISKFVPAQFIGRIYAKYFIEKEGVFPMASRIEQIIEEIEEYIDSCKFQPLSTTKIIVNKDQIDELLRELRMKTPDEIKRYQKIIANKDAILADAQQKAESMIEEAHAQTSELVSEHEIMQQAYAQANEIVMAATDQAQQILDNATNDANDIRIGAVQYTDDLLANAESIIGHTLNSYTSKYDSLVTSLQECYDVVRNNRAELEVPDKSSRGLEAEFGGEAGQTDQGQRE